MLKRIISHRSINVFSFEETEWSFPEHNHNFYEIIFIEKGSGLHHINDAQYPFKEGDIFFLTPNDHHKFQLETKTRFTYVKFNETVLMKKIADGDKTKWKASYEGLFYSPSMVKSNSIVSKQDAAYLFQIVKILKKEYHPTKLYDEAVVLELLGVILAIIMRNLTSVTTSSKADKKPRSRTKLDDMLSYIRQHVLDREKTTIESLAKTFSVSPSYVGKYVKNATGESLRMFIVNSKFIMAERMLKNKELSISQIAYKLDFTDLSHFNKFFRKHKKMTPRVYRKTM